MLRFLEVITIEIILLRIQQKLCIPVPYCPTVAITNLKSRSGDENVLFHVWAPCSCFAFSLTTAYQPTSLAANLLTVLLHTSCTHLPPKMKCWEPCEKTAPVYRNNHGIRVRRIRRARRRKKKEKMERQPVKANTRGNLLNKNFLV